MASTTSGSKKARAAERRRQAQRKKLFTRIGLALAGIGVVVVFIFAFSSGDQAICVTETDSWDLPQLDGEGRVTLAQFEGKPTVAAFFASWCTVCQRELPGFARLSLVIGDEVNFVGINTINNGSGLPFARQAGIDHWPLARDVGLLDGRQLATNFGARGSPTTVIYDDTGKVVDVNLGGMTAGQLADKLDQFFGISSRSSGDLVD